MERRADGTPELASTEAFELLGNETRLAIIVELARHRRTAWRMEGLGFADLRKAVGVRDAGTFNYHLDQLTDRFVVEHDDEYVLTNEGLSIADAILAGQYGDRDVSREAETDYECPECASALVGNYERGLVSLQCPEHGYVVASSLPAGAVANRPMEQVLSIAFQDMQQDVERALEGVCFHCWGRMHATLVLEDPLEHPATGEQVAADPEFPTVAFGCERCETVFWTRPVVAGLRHPAVVAFFHDHGTDIMRSSFVGQTPVNDGIETTVVSTDPVRVRVGFETDDDRVELTLDETATVVETERSRG